MKKINLFIFAMVAMLGFTFSAKAANSVSLTCTKTEIGIGESTTCSVKLNAEVVVNTSTIELSSSEYLDISNVKPNEAAGWKLSTANNATAGKYVFNNESGKTGEIFSFTITLNSKAKALGENDDCGQLCIASATINGTAAIKDTGTCYSPTIIEEECVGEDCNPKTGAFANYAIIIASIIIAGAAVIVARKSTKFFRV